MNTADLITAFFNNEMSPDQERQFLLSVASSDSLRLGLKSHAMLDKILYEQSSQSRVPVEVRMNIMKEAAVVAAAAGSALAADEALANVPDRTTSAPIREKAPAGAGTLPASRRFFRWSSATLLLMIGVGSFFAGFFTGAETADDPVLNSAGQENREIVSPATLPNANLQAPVSSAGQENAGAGHAAVAGRIEEKRTEPSVSVRNADRTSGNRGTSSTATSGRSNGTSSSPNANTGKDGTGELTIPSVSTGPLQVHTVPSDSTHK